MAVPLTGGGGGGGKGLSIKERRKSALENLQTYGHIKLKFVGWYFYWFVTIFAKNTTLLLVQKSEREK